MLRDLMFSSLPVQLFLFVLLTCSNSFTVHAKERGSPKKDSIIFEGGKTEMTSVSGKAQDKKVFDSFLAPPLVEKNGVVVAFAEASYKAANDTLYTGLATKSTKDGGETWSDGNAMIKNAHDFKTFRMVYPTPIVDDDGVTLIMDGYGDWGVPLTRPAGCYHWRLWSGWGTFKSTGTNNGMFLLKNDLTNMIQQHYKLLEKTPYLQLIGGGSPGMKMKNGKYVFPFQALKGNTERNVSLVMYSGNTQNGFALSTHTTDEDCSTPAIAEYEGKRLFMMTSCGGGYRKVYEAYFQEKWKDGVGTLSGVWGNSLKRQWYGVQGGFITATIDGKEVVLVSLPVYTAEDKDGKEKGRLHLWLSDLDRVLDLGPISKEAENAAASSLLYTPRASGNDGEGKLYCLYAAAPNVSSDKYNVVFVDLADKLEKIKKVLKIWEERDKYVLGTQESGSVTGLPSSDAEYNSNNRTHGPIGFLSNRFADGQWKDEYLCVNATVKGHQEENNDGLEFKGPDGGAVWPVGRMGQNQPYYFAKHGFTLLATATIKSVPTEKSIPLMGVKANNQEKSLLFGLSYTKDNKWALLLNNGSEISVDRVWSKDIRYHVALQMKSNQLTLYIDGQEARKQTLDGRTVGLCGVHGLSHFYIGADDGNTKGENDSRLAVRNVLLYKRQLTSEEIKRIKENTDKPVPQLESE